MQAGEEVFNNYGSRGNEEWLLNYGFCLPSNPTVMQRWAVYATHARVTLVAAFDAQERAPLQLRIDSDPMACVKRPLIAALQADARCREDSRRRALGALEEGEDSSAPTPAADDECRFELQLGSLPDVLLACMRIAIMTPEELACLDCHPSDNRFAPLLTPLTQHHRQVEPALSAPCAAGTADATASASDAGAGVDGAGSCSLVSGTAAAQSHGAASWWQPQVLPSTELRMVEFLLQVVEAKLHAVGGGLSAVRWRHCTARHPSASHGRLAVH